MDHTFLSDLSIVYVPLTIVGGTVIVAVTNWAKTQKAVTQNTYLNAIVNLVNETADAVVTSLRQVPQNQPETFNAIKNSVISSAVDSLLSKYGVTVKKAGLDKLALSDMLEKKVIANGCGSLLDADDVKKKYGLTLNDGNTAFIPSFYAVPSHNVVPLSLKEGVQTANVNSLDKENADYVSNMAGSFDTYGKVLSLIRSIAGPAISYKTDSGEVIWEYLITNTEFRKLTAKVNSLESLLTDSPPISDSSNKAATTKWVHDLLNSMGSPNVMVHAGPPITEPWTPEELKNLEEALIKAFPPKDSGPTNKQAKDMEANKEGIDKVKVFWHNPNKEAEDQNEAAAISTKSQALSAEHASRISNIDLKNKNRGNTSTMQVMDTVDCDGVGTDATGVNLTTPSVHVDTSSHCHIDTGSFSGGCDAGGF